MESKLKIIGGNPEHMVCWQMGAAVNATGSCLAASIYIENYSMRIPPKKKILNAITVLHDRVRKS